MQTKDYKKYRWFFTSSGKLVIGGKSASQNDELLFRLKESKEDLILMHTSHPGSPFSAIISDIDGLTTKDLAECAAFTGCFSRAWKEKRKLTKVHSFRLSEIRKDKTMKEGTWAVSSRPSEYAVELELVLTKQKNTYRAVPRFTPDEKEILLFLYPGALPKEKSAEKILKEIKEKPAKKDEILSAIPAGGFKIINPYDLMSEEGTITLDEFEKRINKKWPRP